MVASMPEIFRLRFASLKMTVDSTDLVAEPALRRRLAQPCGLANDLYFSTSGPGLQLLYLDVAEPDRCSCVLALEADLSAGRMFAQRLVEPAGLV